MSEDDRVMGALSDLRRARTLAGRERECVENQAIKTLSLLLRPVVERTLRSRASGSGDPEVNDLLQKVHVALWEGKCNADSGAGVVAFVQRLIQNACTDAHRAARRRWIPHAAGTQPEHASPLERVADGLRPDLQREGREELAALESLCARVLEAAGNKRHRIEVFVNAVLYNRYEVPERVGPGEKRESTRLYQQKYKGRLYFRQVAETLDLGDEDRARVDKLTAPRRPSRKRG